MAGFDYGALAGNILGAGSTIYGASAATKNAKIAAQTADKNNATALELAKLSLEESRLKSLGSPADNSKGSNTTLYIALGVGGVLILGLTIFAVTRK